MGTQSAASSLVLLLVCLNALSWCSCSGEYDYDGAGPTAEQIIGNDRFVEAVERAWRESHVGNGYYQIRGGWVYADAQNPDRLFLRIASQCRSKPATVSQAIQDSEKVELYLDYPENDHDSPPPPFGYKLVADFHTHPFPDVYQEPGQDDINRAFNRHVPAIVYSCKGIFYYGPHRRSSMAGPVGYPANCFNAQGFHHPHYYAPNPFCPRAQQPQDM